MKNYTTKPIELPLSTEKEYVLVDAEGYIKKLDINREMLDEIDMTAPFALTRVDGDGNGFINDNLVIQMYYDEQIRFHEVIRQPESEVEWKNGDECVYRGDVWQFVSILSDEFHGTAVIFDRISEELKQVDLSRIEKPETPEQRKKRERLESIDEMSLIIEMKHGMAGDAYKKYCSSLYDAGYRKEQN